MSMIKDALISGFLSGVIKGQLDTVVMLKSQGWSDSDILAYVLERLKIGLDSAKNLGE